jgi:hypothetical protein
MLDTHNHPQRLRQLAVDSVGPCVLTPNSSIMTMQRHVIVSHNAPDNPARHQSRSSDLAQSRPATSFLHTHA